MSMRALKDLREMLCEELDEIAKKQELSAGDLETVDKLAHSIKNLDKIELYDEAGYSQAGNWTAEMRGNYGRGNSYAGRGEHYVRGHYSRDGMGGYSRESGRESMLESLDRMMDYATTDKERDAIRRCMDSLRNA